MNRFLIPAAFAVGLMVVIWVGMGFVGTSWLALLMTVAIAGAYGLGAFELQQFRHATSTLAVALADIPQPLTTLEGWLERIHPSLRNAVRQRIENARGTLPAPTLTPYLVGLLVMLGMLGTFLGMVVTFKGAVFALEGSADLQAIRSALAAPIKGLGLSFGTSVAGVAASAMLGLMSALSRRERLTVARLLDSRIADVFRPFSHAHQRQTAFLVLQLQTRALPEVVDRLDAMMAQMTQRNQQLNDQLTDRQRQFHSDVTVAYTDLADAVGQSLKDSLVASARAAGESIRPVVEAAMTNIAHESRLLHERAVQTAQAQVAGLGAEFSATAHRVSDGWTTALQNQVHTSEDMTNRLAQTLAAFSATLAQRAETLLSDHNTADRLRLEAWTQALTVATRAQQADWQRASAQTLAQQQAICHTLEATAAAITGHTADQAQQTLGGIAQLLERSEALVGARITAEADWIEHQGARMDQLTRVWRQELGALRDDEASRGQAAVERLGELQSNLSIQLATLGTALQAPMSQLMQAAAEAPRAATQLIAQLRQEMTGLAERDNLALEERTQLMARLDALLLSTEQTSQAQRSAIESLTTSATTVLDQAHDQFAELLGDQANKAAALAANVSGSAIELSCLGESFHLAVKLFGESNHKLVESLQRIESAVSHATQRSDEQLTYYVGQAREVIDLSLSAQQAVVADLRRLHKQATQTTEAA